MAPWRCYTDSLEYCTKHDENRAHEVYIREKANIQFKSVNFMRGRSIHHKANRYLDEIPNLTASH